MEVNMIINNGTINTNGYALGNISSCNHYSQVCKYSCPWQWAGKRNMMIVNSFINNYYWKFQYKVLCAKYNNARSSCICCIYTWL